MSEGFVYQRTALRPGQRDLILSRILWGVIILLILLAAGKLIFQFVVAPHMKITNIILENESIYSKEEVLSIAGIEKNKYYFQRDLNEMEMRLEAVPQISDARILRESPGTLKILLGVSEPVALALAQSAEGEKTIPVAFSAEGEIIMVGKQVNPLNLPVISGLKFNSFDPGMKLPRQLLACVRDLRLLKENYREMFDLISEIRIEPVGSLDYELVLYLIPYRTRIRVGRDLLGEQLGYALMVLDVLERKELSPQVKEIDFRTNEVVFKEEGGATY